MKVSSAFLCYKVPPQSPTKVKVSLSHCFFYIYISILKKEMERRNKKKEEKEKGEDVKKLIDCLYLINYTFKII